MKIEHLISTMYQENPSFLKTMGLKCDCVAVNQTDKEDYYKDTNGDQRCVMVSTTERGLSNSRNMLLNNAGGEVCIIGDDDILYLEGYENIIEKAYAALPDADIISFSFTQSLDTNTRRQFPKVKKLNILSISKIASVEVTFKLNSVRAKQLSFCPLLGVGAKYGSCEENAFLADALRASLKIYYYPATICYLKPDPEDRVKWKNGFDEEYFVKKGAGFYRIYGKLFLPMAAAFIGTKKFGVFKNVPLFKALGWMKKGKQEFIKDMEQEKCS